MTSACRICVQGGADAILVPSRFEPCGLTQFCGLRYGCVPVVARVGGLADSIVDANDAGLAAERRHRHPVHAGRARPASKRRSPAPSRSIGDRAVWTRMQKRGMKTDVSWTASAGRYAALYRGLLEGKAP